MEQNRNKGRTAARHVACDCSGQRCGSGGGGGGWLEWRLRWDPRRMGMLTKG